MSCALSARRQTLRLRTFSYSTLALLAFLCLFPTPVKSQQVSFNVVEVEVIGARTTKVELIKSVAGIVIGQNLGVSTARNAVTGLDGLGLFDQIEILGEEVTGGIKVYIRVREFPRIASLKFVGNNKLDKDDLNEVVRLSVGNYLSGSLEQEKKNAILRAYADKGYYLTEVEVERTIDSDSANVDLVYRIKENDKIKVRTVYLTGAKIMDPKDIIKVMRNRKRGFLKSSNYTKDEYPEDLQKVIDRFHKHGFMDAYLISDSTRIDTLANRMDIYLEVYEGPRYYFGEVTFSGNDVYTDEMLAKTLKFDEGDVFDEEEYDESVFEMYSAYQERGRLNTRIQDIKTTHDTLIDIEYKITEGLPSHVNLIHITGNHKTKDNVIRRELSILPGQVFHRSLMIRSIRNVMALNYFSNVTPDVINLPNGDVDLVMDVEEKQTGQLTAGAGYSARDKLVGNFGMGIPNLFGGGQTLRFNVEFGGRRNSASISFTEPWLFGRPTLLGSDVFWLNRRFEGIYTEGRRGGSARLGKRLNWPDNYFRVSLGYRLEGDRFFDFSDAFAFSNTINFVTTTTTQDTTTINVNGIDTLIFSSTTVADTIIRDTIVNSLLSFEEKWNLSSSLSLTITRDSRNLPEFATAGSRFRYSVSYTGGLAGGFWNYHRHLVEFTQYLNLYKGIALAAKVQLGAIGAPKGDRFILELDRFSPGGTSFLGIVRGYNDGSLTPDTLFKREGDTSIIILDSLIRDPGGTFVVGDTSIADTILPTPFSTRVRGKYLLTTNWEVSVPLVRNSIYFLTFFDAGNSWLRWKDIDPIHDMFPSAGFGFRIAVPGIGTIGFDFGYPLRAPVVNGIVQEQNLKTHFQLGSVFR